jgi:hypothetical protein
MATTTKPPTQPSPTVLPPDEARALFDRQARRLVGLSGEEFLAKWDAGEYRDRDLDATPEGRKIAHLVLLIPFGRPHP